MERVQLSQLARACMHMCLCKTLLYNETKNRRTFTPSDPRLSGLVWVYRLALWEWVGCILIESNISYTTVYNIPKYQSNEKHIYGFTVKHTLGRSSKLYWSGIQPASKLARLAGSGMPSKWPQRTASMHLLAPGAAASVEGPGFPSPRQSKVERSDEVCLDPPSPCGGEPRRHPLLPAGNCRRRRRHQRCRRRCSRRRGCWRGHRRRHWRGC